MYKGVVSIRSECTIADEDDFQEVPIVYLTSKSRNIRKDLYNNLGGQNVPLI